MKRLDVAVIGGSIAGLTAACLLARSGHTVSVHERSARRPLQSRGGDRHASGAPVGAGTLRQPGRRARSRGDGRGPQGPRPGRPCHRGTQAAAGARGWGRLYRLLLDALPPDRVRFGAALATLDHQGDRVVASFADGRRITADLLVGADGQFSTVRDRFLNAVTPTYAGYVAWRAVVDEAALSGTTRAAICGHFAFCLPPGEQILGYPVSSLEDGTGPSGASTQSGTGRPRRPRSTHC